MSTPQITATPAQLAAQLKAVVLPLVRAVARIGDAGDEDLSADLVDALVRVNAIATLLPQFTGTANAAVLLDRPRSG